MGFLSPRDSMSSSIQVKTMGSKMNEDDTFSSSQADPFKEDGQSWNSGLRPGDGSGLEPDIIED